MCLAKCVVTILAQMALPWLDDFSFIVNSGHVDSGRPIKGVSAAPPIYGHYMACLLFTHVTLAYCHAATGLMLSAPWRHNTP